MSQTDKAIKVVLAEDEPLIAMAYQKGLTYHGFKVTVAGDGKEALEVIEKEQPHVLLLDFIMPIMNGMEVLEIVKSKPELSHMPIIVLTNLGQPSDAKRVIGLGAKAYLIKSNLSLQELVDSINDAVVNT